MTQKDEHVDFQIELFKRARAARQPLDNLMSSLVERCNLEAAVERVASSDGASTPGIDGIVARQIAAKAGTWIPDISRQLLEGQYRPQLPRWVHIDKPNGGERKIGILTITDRIVHAAVKQVLEPILEPRFLNGSFGFRPGRSVTGALEAVCDQISDERSNLPKFSVAVNADISDCFDTIDHDLLIAQLREFVGDPAMIDLVRLLLQAVGTTRRSWFTTRRVGVVQGSALSPLLCNLYLHRLDTALDHHARNLAGAVAWLRYADDLLILARDRQTARHGLAVARRTLAELRQSFGKKKLRISRTLDGFDWLGVQIRQRNTPWSNTCRFGYVIDDQRVSQMLERIDEMTTPPSSRIDTSAFDPGRWIQSLNDQLRQWRQAFLFADNAYPVFQAVDEHTQSRVARLLDCLTGKKPYALEREYRIRLPRGFSTWQIGGTRLVCLSSLAPHHPRFLTRKPVWMQKRRTAQKPDLRFPQDQTRPLASAQ